ncbi:MAG: hypothetical protein CMA93_05400 [Euryarchaeota archaeon]|nr:hypothetical protein [Euryarchaeota archaeon]|tara:strand:+ start:3501 stop:3869 length:369 start_codon:yes stop_codon:yes gene_type:complete
MVGVLVDACGWVALVEARLNLDSSMEDVVGTAELKLLECVDKEIESVSTKQKGLLLELLRNRCEVLRDLEGMRHPDEMLISLSSQNGWPVLTVDTDLKRLLIEQGGSYIEVTSGRYLRLVEA